MKICPNKKKKLNQARNYRKKNIIWDLDSFRDGKMAFSFNLNGNEFRFFGVINTTHKLPK